MKQCTDTLLWPTEFTAGATAGRIPTQNALVGPIQFTSPAPDTKNSPVCVVSGVAAWIGQLLLTFSDFTFSVGDSLELSGTQFTPPDTTQTALSGRAVWLSCRDGRLVGSAAAGGRARRPADRLRAASLLRQLRDGEHAVRGLRGRRPGRVPRRLGWSAGVPSARPLVAARRRQLRPRLRRATQAWSLHARHQVRRLDPTTHHHLTLHSSDI